MVVVQLHVFLKHKDTKRLAVAIPLYDRQSWTTPSHCHTGGKMHHFMTFYKIRTFHCKLCRKKPKTTKFVRKPNLKNISLKLCHFTNGSHWLPLLSTAKGLLHCDWPNAHMALLSPDKSSKAASSFMRFAWWPSHNQLTHTHSDGNMYRHACSQKKKRPDRKRFPNKNLKSPSRVSVTRQTAQWPWCDLTPCRHAGEGKARWMCTCVCASF